MKTKAIGKKCWLVPDGYIPQLTENDSNNQNGYVSHECVCILNTGPNDAIIGLTVYFEDAPPKAIKDIVVPAQRSSHLRMDKIETDGQPAINRAVPYSLLVESSEPIVVQMSRLDTTQNNMSFLSTMAWPVDAE
jgi:hypothetical protein